MSDDRYETAMKRDNAIRRIEAIEEDLSLLVQEANDEAEGTTMTPVIRAEDVNEIREQLTDARTNLVDALLEEELDNDER